MEFTSGAKNIAMAVSVRKGGLRTLPFVIANESLERVASVGLAVNMILYLKSEYHLSNITATNILFLWSAISNFLPIFGAFLSDSYLGRFHVIALGSILSLSGMNLLWFTSIFPKARPPKCEHSANNCQFPSTGQFTLLFSAFALMSIGAGGIRPCSLAFGADQFNKPENPKNERVLQSFFNWYYVSVGISVIIAITIIVYIQSHFGWEIGFGIPVGLMLISTMMFFVGSPLYVKVKANKSMITSFAQVIAAAVKNRNFASQAEHPNVLYFHKEGSKLVAPSKRLRILNTACIIRNSEKDLNRDGTAIDSWSLCTVQEVEILKALIRVLPIWSSGIMIAVTISQHTFPVLQALTMDRHFGKHFEIPAGSFGVFGILTLTLWVAIYDRLIVPWISKYTKRPRGLSLKQRMGIGLVISCLATSVAAIVESKRRVATVKMSAIWIIPQHSLIGLAEAFNAIGQIEFYYSQFPKSMSSIAVSLLALGFGFGNVVGSLIVSIINSVTKKGGHASWLGNSLNKSHYDYYYWILTILGVVNFFYYLLVSWNYGSETQMVWDEEEEEAGIKGGDVVHL